MLVSCRIVSGACDEDALGSGGGGQAYQLRVELGQPRLALAIKDQKGVDHSGRLCGLRQTRAKGDFKVVGRSSASRWDAVRQGPSTVTVADIVPRLRDVMDGMLKRSYLDGRRTDVGHDP